MEPEIERRLAWAGDNPDQPRLGRLRELPMVSLQPVWRPLSDYWSTAPEWLRRRARRPLTPAEKAVWEAIRDGTRLGTDALAKVPVWIPEHEVGYVLDFLLPEYGINVQIDAWDPSLLEGDEPEFDFEADPDNPENFDRDHDLLEAEGIETVSYWDESVDEMGGAGIAEEIRKELGIGELGTGELGIGRPPWLTRMPGAKPSGIPPP